MSAWQQMPDGRWLPAEPLPESFGVVWERFWKLRRERGERKWPALVRAFFDTRAVTRPVTPTDEQLANFATLRCFGACATPVQRRVALDLIQASSVVRALWLEQHSAFQDELRKLAAAPAPVGADG